MAQTSKPLSRPTKASFNPLFANKTFSTILPIKVRCSSETDACRSMFVNISGASGSPEAAVGVRLPLKGSVHSYPAVDRTVRGLHCWSPDPGPPKCHLRVMSSSSLAPPFGHGRPSATTPRSRPPYWVEKPVEASHFRSSQGEGPPKNRIVVEDCVLSCKEHIFQALQETNGICLKHPCLLTIWPKACPRHETVLRRPPSPSHPTEASCLS